MSSSVVEYVLPTAVGQAQTFTFNYPAGQSAALYLNAVAHKMYAIGTEYLAPKDFTLAFNPTNITATLLAPAAFPAGERVRVSLDKLGYDATPGKTINSRIIPAPSVFLDLGAPLTAAANGICLTQAVAGGAAFLLNGARVVNGQAILDTPRNIVAAWTATSVLTIRGFDVDNQPLTELSASGVAHTGLKTFAIVSEIRSMNAITAATVGFGTSIGLPARIAHASHVLQEFKQGVLSSTISGTITPGITTTSTGTSGDVRGKYVPSVAPDGATSYGLLAAMVAPDDRGVPQYVA